MATFGENDKKGQILKKSLVSHLCKWFLAKSRALPQNLFCLTFPVHHQDPTHNRTTESIPFNYCMLLSIMGENNTNKICSRQIEIQIKSQDKSRLVIHIQGTYMPFINNNSTLNDVTVQIRTSFPTWRSKRSLSLATSLLCCFLLKSLQTHPRFLRLTAMCAFNSLFHLFMSSFLLFLF